VADQQSICARVGAEFCPTLPLLEVGLALNARMDLRPLNGLRHAPKGDTSGWYIWAGEIFSKADDFFQPIHVEHLTECCPDVIPYLGLPPGWRFLIAKGHEDVWYDPALLDA
jgi:hypothetical protein